MMTDIGGRLFFLLPLLPEEIGRANRRPSGQSDGSGGLSAIVAADRAFPAAVAELGLACLCA